MLWRRRRPAPNRTHTEPRARTDSTAGQRADCCVAAAVYRVVLPVTERRARPTELLLCAHHYRSARATLSEGRAAIFDAEHRLVTAEE